MDNWVTNSVPSFARNLNILLVDHDPVSLQHLASLLEQQAYNVTTTQLASVALSMIQEKVDWFNLVMANASMPDMDGFSFLHVLHKKNIAVILMSSGTNLNVATRALAEGACYFLQKPISKDDLKYVWQHVYLKNRNVIKQMQNVNDIEKAKPGKESGAIKIADPVVLSRHAAADENINGIGCQPIINRIKDMNKKISYDGLVRANFGGEISINDIEGRSKEKRVKYDFEPADFGSTIDEEREKMKEHYISSVSRTRVVWNAERRRKFTNALSKLGDKTRPKLILKMMNEPCLTLRQVANHLQKYKAKVECIKKKRENKLPSRQASKSNASARTQFPPLLGKQHHETRNFGSEGLRSVVGGDRYRPIAPKTLPNRKPPVSEFVNHGHRIFNHNFQHIVLNYNSVSLNINEEAGLCPDCIQKFQNEGSTFHTDSRETFAFEGGVRISKFNLPNASKMASEAASSDLFDDVQFPDNVLDVMQQLDLTAFELENQESLQPSGTADDIQLMPGIALPTPNHPDNVAADICNGSNEMGDVVGQEVPTDSANEGSCLLAEYADVLNVLEDDLYNYGGDLNLGDVEKYCEWLSNTVLENRNGPDSFISGGMEMVPNEKPDEIMLQYMHSSSRRQCEVTKLHVHAERERER